MSNPHLVFSTEVRQALAQKLPVVALESTIITHGMPYPFNVETALAVEAVIRANGATPATIAVLDGKLVIGLTEPQITELARTDNVVKCSRRDLGAVLAKRQTGATTVSGTMIAAYNAGIRVFATGGIGGVHRQAQQTMDISADLTELARTPVAVVCAGAKSILDIGLTLEVLETQGVPVFGFDTVHFPAFYVRESAYPVDASFEQPEQVAAALKAHWNLGLGGALIANPIPREAELPAQEIDEAIATALAQAEASGIVGKAVTPFLLDRLNIITRGRSLEANIALILHNAKLGAKIAIALQS